MVTSSSERPSTLLAFSNGLADAVEQAGRAVVAVNARQRISSSGIHWRQGLVVTADHTVRRDEEITVTLPGAAPESVGGHYTVPATLVGRDASTDLALLKLQDIELPTADIGNTSSLKVGHLVLAVARLGESGLSASLGVISALGGAWQTWSGGQIDQFVRLDLTLYPGFSGGPLIDAQGHVVGINTSGPRSMVLAIPTATVDRVVDQLLERGHVARGYLGLGMQPVRLPDRLKSLLNLQVSSGVIVVTVEPDGPAEKAGVLIGDILIAIQDHPVSDTGDVQTLLSPERAGKLLRVQIIRGGTLAELAITLGERPHREENYGNYRAGRSTYSPRRGGRRRR
jgi:S1-C subfamily serine protease